jgi:hypothetical protein
MSLVSDIINDALFYIGCYGPGETVSSEEQSFALRCTNRMLDSWSAEKLSAIGVRQASYALDGSGQYAFGVGQSWNATNRPIKIKAASTIPSYGTLSVSTTIAANIAVGTKTVTPASMYHIQAGTRVTVANSDASNTETTMVLAITSTTFTAVFALTKTGPGITVTAAGLPSGLEKPARIVTAEEWVTVADKTRTGIFIEDLMYDNGWPTGNIFVTPMPPAGSVSLWTYEAITNFVNLTDAVSLPPGFERPLVLVLALEMCLPFSRPIPDGLPQLAQAAKLTIQALAAEILGTPMPGAPAQPPQPGQGKQ